MQDIVGLTLDVLGLGSTMADSVSDAVKTPTTHKVVKQRLVEIISYDELLKKDIINQTKHDEITKPLVTEIRIELGLEKLSQIDTSDDVLVWVIFGLIPLAIWLFTMF